MTLLLVLNVTVEQEQAIQKLFDQHCWIFCNLEEKLSGRLKKQLLSLQNVPVLEDDKQLLDGRGQNKICHTKSSDCFEKKEIHHCRITRDKALHEIDGGGKPEKVSKINDKNITRSGKGTTCFGEEVALQQNSSTSQLRDCDDVKEHEIRDKEKTNSLECSLQNHTENCRIGKVIGNSDYKTCICKADKGKNEFGFCTANVRSFTEDDVGQGCQKGKLVLQNKGGNYSCSKCERVFKSRTGIYYHMKGFHSQGYSYRCKVCEKTFLFKAHYVGHMDKHNQKKPFSCETCNTPFRYKHTLNAHKKSCTCIGVKQPRSSSKQKSYVLCDLCGANLSSKSALKQHHIYMHSDDPKQMCQDCGKCFKTEATLKRHIKIAHQDGKIRSYSCDKCGVKFKQAEVLRQHMMRHDKNFSIYCETCGKGFYSQYKLKEHQRMHTGEKPFSCPVCLSYRSSTKSNLLKHLKLHEKQNQAETNKMPLLQRSRKTDRFPVSLGSKDGNQLDLSTNIGKGLGANPRRHAVMEQKPSEFYHPQTCGSHTELYTDMTVSMKEGDIETSTYIVLPSNNPSYMTSQDSYYEDTVSESTVQSMDIVTTALNIVNPSQY